MMIARQQQAIDTKINQEQEDQVQQFHNKMWWRTRSRY